MATIEKQIRDFFFNAMVRGYSSGAPKRDVPDMPGFREIEIREGDFRLLDRYSRYLGTVRSATGTITIWMKDQPVWTMYYRGSYRKDALPHLRVSLHKAYEERRFEGGRGVLAYTKGLYSYTNEVARGHFESFSGRENIRAMGGEYDHITGPQYLGGLNYEGGLL